MQAFCALHLVTLSSINVLATASSPKRETNSPRIAFQKTKCTTDSYVTYISAADAPSLGTNYATNPESCGESSFCEYLE